MDSGKSDNSRPSKPIVRLITLLLGLLEPALTLVMDFLGAIVNINKALEKAQEKPPDLKTLLRSLV